MKYGNGCKYFQRRGISTAGHYHIRLGILIVTCPFPDTNSFRTMNNCLFHCKPLRQRMFSCNHYVDIMPAAQAMIKDRQQTIGIRRQISTNNISLLIDNMVEETRILMCESVMILLPYMRSEQKVKRGYLSSPWQLQSYLQPLGMLAEH